jgi:OOP family OmpA-OmpF porin
MEETAPAMEMEEEEEPDEVAMTPKDSDGDGVPDVRDKCPGTPSGTRVNSQGCPEDRSVGTMLDFPYVITLLFDTDSSSIREEYAYLHEEVIAFRKENRDAVIDRIVVEGHADSTGTDEHNMRLSRRRAEGVKSYLVDNLGVSRNIVETAYYGESQPVASNRTKAGRQENRRVIVTIYGHM